MTLKKQEVILQLQMNNMAMDFEQPAKDLFGKLQTDQKNLETTGIEKRLIAREVRIGLF
jgi:hypothetical protein